jgi:hypothetical protein
MGHGKGPQRDGYIIVKAEGDSFALTLVSLNNVEFSETFIARQTQKA